jgi:hypothetical protein
MPAFLPGSTDAQNAANPSAGATVLMSPLTGPKNAPLDIARNADGSAAGISTGIGFGSPPIVGLTAPSSIQAAGFSDDYVPGLTMPDGSTAPDSRLWCVGGGRTLPSGAPGTPYTAGSGLPMAGNGGSRDAGGGAGFATRMVTATASVANGGVVEAGFLNRSGQTITNGQSVFGSATAASTVPT